MASKTFCDRCGLEINRESKVRIEIQEDGAWMVKDFHIDCINFELSADVRKLVGKK